MTANELRQKFLDFFKEKGHAILPSASLIPENDPTVLFTTAGMHPLVPYLLGEKHPLGKRLADAQICIRTGDIDEVGDETHLTFFEMLGNWSLGDYFKREAIEWSWEFLADKKWLGIDLERLSITVFAGDNDAPRDEESAKIWQLLGVPAEKISYKGKDDNWWGPAGQSGPCGPDTEMFIDGMEIWNDVFMEYNKKLKVKSEELKVSEYEYEFVSLSQKNVDTGMGLERMLAVLNGCKSVYETELFLPIIKKIAEISDKEYAGENVRVFRIIADHIKAATFLLAEGLEPSNVERGYILRRLIRRAVRYGKQLGVKDIFTFIVAQAVIAIYKDAYQQILKNKDFIEEQLVREEEKFTKTLEMGLRELEKMKPKKFVVPIPSLSSKSFGIEYGLSGDDLFNLYSTYGFPIEMSLEEIKKSYQEYNREQGVNITELPKDYEDRILQQFHASLKRHQELSRAGAEQKFAGGLADHSEQVIKYHTAAHLMLAALRRVLGGYVVQRGSNITAERLRFDFSHSERLTPEQIKQVEDLVNEKIQTDLPVVCEEMDLEEAKKKGAMGVFEAKYGERVKVYAIGKEDTFSKEICGGPHVERTGQLGKFKIIKEESSSAGVRRIKAVLE